MNSFWWQNTYIATNLTNFAADKSNVKKLGVHLPAEINTVNVKNKHNNYFNMMPSSSASYFVIVIYILCIANL